MHILTRNGHVQLPSEDVKPYIDALNLKIPSDQIEYKAVTVTEMPTNPIISQNIFTFRFMMKIF